MSNERSNVIKLFYLKFFFSNRKFETPITYLILSLSLSLSPSSKRASLAHVDIYTHIYAKVYAQLGLFLEETFEYTIVITLLTYFTSRILGNESISHINKMGYISLTNFMLNVRYTVGAIKS